MNAIRSVLGGAMPLAIAILSCGCGAARFRDQPIVWRVDDTADTPPLEEREFLVHQYAADIFALRRLTRAMELRTKTPARNVNALDEVPDSTWFTNRIGKQTITPERAARGADEGGPPRLPLLVTQAKRGGTNPGFVAKDATGRKFVIKFDPVQNLELQTAASVIVNRFFWTIGYNVPSDHVFRFTRSDLQIDPKARLAHAGLSSTQVIDAILRVVPRLPDGSFRASSSEFVHGEPKGGFAAEGIRSEDPNDRVPHEDRRELRGLRVFAAWLDHTDMKEDNGLDVYVTDADGRRYLRHFLIDFGEALGGHAAEKARPEDGFEYAWDWELQGKAALAMGLWKRPWESRQPSGWTSVGSLLTTNFDPEGWREAYPYWPFFERDAADDYWGAKIVMQFTREHVEALVATGKLSDPHAAAHLVDAIMVRREKIGRAYLEAVSAIDDFHIEGDRICAADVSTRFGIAHGGLVQQLSERGNVLSSHVIAPDGTVCLPLPSTKGDYEVLRLRIRRGSGDEGARRPMQVHVKDRTRILGIMRIEP